MLKTQKRHGSINAPTAADGVRPRARHPWLWFVLLYGAGVLVTLVVALVFHVLVFAAS